MALIDWDDKFSVGVASVDHEHRQLLELINETYNRMIRPGAEDAVKDFLGEIFARISMHFALEEKIMRQHHYDHYAEHKADHERLLDEIRDIMDDYEERKYFSEEQCAHSLQQWFIEHFRTHDARLHRRLD
ncbi:MAG: bacteriohemerythrin [Sulfuricaulis sp.]|jgi:hemerythrin-like metal-binding protein|uniref:bacteriohemerythrin n=1 Tax=Sulfuricaulis sp. TaxID=2003553 RepID=UPI002CEA8C4B|nr:bacteriohemerythrin [Sulfuricaulis sp.]